MKVSITVSGKVQGVGFRYTTKMLADELGILGIVKNKDNGDVYIEAMGDSERMATFIKGIEKSPAPFGRVDYISINEQANFEDYRKFSVTY